MQSFFSINDIYFFPMSDDFRVINDAMQYFPLKYRICFRYENQYDRPELGQSIGYYGYAWMHLVIVFDCTSCGLKYHIIKCSPFAFRDKSKDVK